MRGIHSSVETVNAAAAAIVSAESRVQQVAVPVNYAGNAIQIYTFLDSINIYLSFNCQRKRWTAWLSVYWCFGSHRSGRRISHAVLIPEPAFSVSDASARSNPSHPPEVRLPFIAPPSSPASFLPSGIPSATQSPAGPLSLSALSQSSYSPSGPASIFAIGPYANETQLVSPPVFSTFTTEPSTAPLTPPPEPFHLTTPSSPEVPFAKLLTSSINANCKKSEAYEFQSYQFYPGSPIGCLISPSSACSGTSSPFPDPDFYSSAAGSFQSFLIGEPPKILSAEGISARKLIPRHARNDGSLLDGQISAAASTGEPAIVPKINEHTMDHRVSFELTAEEFARRLEKKVAMSGEGKSEILTARSDKANPSLGTDSSRISINDTYHDLPEKAQPFVTPAKEFKFDNSDGVASEPNVGSDWWANEKVAGTGTEHRKSWAFFPMIQPGVS
ncbi:hypothetical protein BHE74_00003999 [Ensete ventricosum]|nr:hypothetical protein GW17_00015250 [Ensete ventricosum]RWW87196.1 hypothetical protein BHE74_00003999 [Ensete ventricosum]RZR81709.1 hypothetical protein BHM03_00008001 [Ensete ventricosum]